MRHSLLCCLTGAYLFLAACASSLPPYVEPQEGNLARIRLAIPQENGLSLNSPSTTVRGYQSEDCKGHYDWTVLANYYLVGRGTRKLGLPLWEYNDNGAREYYVATDRPIIVTFEGRTGDFVRGSPKGQTCVILVNRTLEPDRDYELVYEHQSATKCIVTLNELIVEGGNAQRVELATYQRIGQFVNPGCLRAFRKFY